MRKVHAIPNTGFARSYVIVERRGLVVIDVGSRGCAEDVVEYINTTLGRDIDEVRFIAATHYHIDHIGGIGHLLKRCPRETGVLFHHRVKDYLTGKGKLSLIRNWCVGLTPATLVSSRYVRRLSHGIVGSMAGIPLPFIRTFTRIPVDASRISYFGTAGTGRYRLGFEAWDVIETPGHTEDSVCFFNEETGELISGDTIINISKGGRGSLNRFCWNRERIRESYNMLCRGIEPEVIYPGHGEVIRNGKDLLMRVATF